MFKLHQNLPSQMGEVNFTHLLISEIFKDLQMDSPSAGFTDRVMQSIQMDSSPSTYSSTTPAVLTNE